MYILFCCCCCSQRILQESGGNGYIILGVENGVDSIVNESSTDSPSISCKEEWQLFSSPPSPCNVHFEGDNVVINGKSNLRKHPKEKKVSPRLGGICINR